MNRCKQLLAALVLTAATMLAHATCVSTIPASTPTVDFSDNGDGTLLHKSTGLTWMRCALGQTWSGGTCNGNTFAYTWQQALQAAKSLNDGGGYAGHTDWALPNSKELASIVETQCIGPAINATAFPNTPASYFWSASANANYASYAWFVYFNDGYDGYSNKGYAYQVRLVRGGQSFDPLVVPSAPVIGTAIAGNAQATISFIAPVSNGGSAITGYTVKSNPVGGLDTNAGSTALSHLVTGLANGTAYTFTVSATNGVGTSLSSAASNSVTPTPVPGAPSILAVTAGVGSASISFAAPASNGGSAITGYTATCTASGLTTSTASAASSPITVQAMTGGIAYVCSVTASNSVGSSAPSAGLSVTPTLPPVSARLINLSTRGPVQTGDNIMIGGFVIGGTVPKSVLIRAVGPNLANFGVTGVLANPLLKLFSGQTMIASNDDWGSAANAAAIQTSGLAPANSLESAILTTLNPGAYTAQVSGADGGSGVGIVEVFEIDQADSPLINISTRGQVQTGDNVMIGGFVIKGSSPQTVLIRAVGPNLANFGVTGVLSNPMLELYSGPTQIASNDDWGNASNAAAIQASGKAPVDAKESAILMTLNPGAYTAKVSGVGGVTGIAIIEVFAQ